MFTRNLHLALTMLVTLGLGACGGSSTPSPSDSAGTCAISGHVNNIASPAAVTISGSVTRTATTDSQKGYGFTGLPCGTYTVTPSSTGLSFDPPSATITVQGNAVEDFYAIVCNSAAASLANHGGSCTVGAGATVQVSVSLACKCTDTNASCQAEWVGNHLEVAPVVQQCSNNAGCNTAGCDVSGRAASCAVTIPASVASGAYPIVDGSGTTVGTVNVAATGSSCSL